MSRARVTLAFGSAAKGFMAYMAERRAAVLVGEGTEDILASGKKGAGTALEITDPINVIQEVEGKLNRITVPRDEMKIISIGPIRPNQVKNLLDKGDFVPLP